MKNIHLNYLEIIKKIKYSDNINPEHKLIIKGVPAVFIGGILTDRNKLKYM
tara:strand:+ start:319 stop:471 length:153 start_codon:yes stop_codon:yes gene_type:complete